MDENINKENSGELFGFDPPSDLDETPTVGEPLEPQEEFRVEPPADGDRQPEQPTATPNDRPQFVPNGSYGSAPAGIRQDYVTPAYQKPKPPKKRFSFAALIAAVLIAAIVGAGSGIGTILYLQAGTDVTSSTVSESTDTISQETVTGNVTIDVQNVEATVVEAVAAKVTPSVVGIRTTVSVNNFFGGTSQASGEGSGVIYTADGYIITNYHVIQDAIENSSGSPEIQVYLSENSEQGYPATVVGYNISYDLAVIKINATGLTPVTFSDSSDLKVGQFVVAIGNPGGLVFMGSVTYGVISGLNRIFADASVGSGVELIQTDAAINPGNSGGALVNISGELVGINSSKIVSQSYEGMGFAIPSNTVKEMCDKIIAKEYDPDPYIGVTISERYDAETLKAYGYPVGAVVRSVAGGSPAAEIGISSGDIITKFNDIEITDYTVFNEVLSGCKPGDTVSVELYRSRRYYSASITVGSNNAQ